MILWLVAGLSLAAALLAWRSARRTAQRLDQLSQMYWSLKYQHEELRRQIRQPGPMAEGDDRQDRESLPAGGAADRPAGAFVPLSSLKR